MKKCRALLVILLSLFLFGCSNDQYAIEKQYYGTIKEAEKIFKNPHASPPNELQRVVAILSDFSRKYPKSNLAVDAEFSIARLYIVKEEYQTARKQLQKIINTYTQSKILCSEALFLVGNSYEIENKWDSALAEYKKIMRDYPATPSGINTPIYIIQHYKIKFQPDKMMEASRDAIKHYNTLSESFPKTPLAYRAQSLIAQCYMVLKDWQGAINTYNSIIDTYKGKIGTDGTLLEIALIYKRELKDEKKAKDTLEQFIKEYPQSKLLNFAKSLLKEVKK